MQKKYIIYTILLLAFLERTLFDLGPNIELITLFMISSYLVLGIRKSLVLTFLVLILSDVFIGNSNIYIFTWSGFLLPILLFRYFNLKSTIARGTFMALGFNLFFFLWTNLGVWYLDSWGMYSRNISGLLMSYANGLPFLRLHIVNSLLTVPVGLTVIFHLKKITLLSRLRLQHPLKDFQDEQA